MKYMKEFHDTTMEGVVLSVLINKPETIYVCDLTEDDFYLDKHKKIFRLIKQQQAQNKPFDYFTLAESIKEDVDLFICLSNIQSNFYLSLETNFEEYVRILKEKRLKRDLYIKISEFQSLLEENQGLNINEIIKDLEKILEQNTDYKEKDFKDLLQDWWYTTIEKKGKDFIKSGISIFDKKFYGFNKGTLNIIACRPSIGKTTLSIQLAYNFVKQNFGVCFFSLEMNTNQIIHRLISQITEVPHNLISSGEFINSDYNSKIAQCLTEINDYKLFILDEHNLDVNKLERIITIYKNKHNIDIVIIDYLTLLNMPFGEKKTDRIGEITRRLKLLAKKLDIVIILLSQLNRNTESREEKKPHLADLRDSGNIEQDADVVMLIWRKPDNKGLPSEDTEIIVAKNRDGAIGSFNLKFKSNILKFIENE